MAQTVPPRPSIVVRPANDVSWAALDLIMGARGCAARCRCQRYKLAPGESFASHPAAARAERLRAQAHCDQPGAGVTSGLVAHVDDEPAGWCAVEPRTAYAGLVRHHRVPWLDRTEDKADDGIWAVTCLFTRVGFRRRGVSRALAVAAVDFARERGARALEAYPITTTDAMLEERHVGVPSVFAAAGLVEVSRPTPRRAVLRIEFC